MSTATCATCTDQAKARIGFAAIGLIVPEDAGRSLVAAERDDFAVRCAIALAGGEEFVAA